MHEFRIDGIRLSEARFSLNKGFNWGEKKSIELKQHVEVKHKNKDKVIQVIVSVSSDSENQPFRYSIAWEGAFSFKEMPSKDALDRIARINCAAIIFPYVRETIADLTRRANLPPLNLNPINFVAMYEKQKKEGAVTIKKSRKKVTLQNDNK